MKTIITISGTHCRSCKLLIEDVCGDIAGIRSCSVNYETGETVIEYDPVINWEIVKKEINGFGQYRVDFASALYECSLCGFRYESESWAKQCEAWCTEHHSCNLDITQHAKQK